ncbi:MAG: Hemin transport system permease protein HmuU [Luteibacter sp.]|uniref:FecCD family ABC transporter permease n=1 Tax=Luteibacter sp. TaxID=1886636 RepID=UPI001386023A|nr:iron ABC transporter permease [Luteibacter sp.]KAF1007780.1 MAG: Hemin transport system permease protein HmuU [Luteibacter sp.]
MNAVTAAIPRARSRRGVALLALVALLLAASLWNLSQGAIDIPARQIVAALARWFDGIAAIDDDNVVLMLRLPRLMLAVLVGAALASGGASMQGLFRNPLADPGLIGVSSGAALGAIAAIVIGHQSGSWLVALSAFIGGLVATSIVYMLGRRRPGVANLLLAGVAINAIAMAGVGMLTYMASEHQLRDLTFWTLGSLGGATWSKVGIVAPWILLPLLCMPKAANALNALLLGEGEASLLGFRPERLRPLLVGLVALAVGAAVAFSGVIGFVGLVVPHLLRMVFGPDHRFLLPASALGGASLLVGADALARTVVAPGELPIGVLTALVGGPFFLWLLVRKRVGEGVR